MAAISEKILWPAVAILIFGILAGFYIDDRRGLMKEDASADKQQASTNEHGGKAAQQKQTSNEHAGKAVEKKSSTAASKQTASSSGSSSSGKQSASATSMDIKEYLSQSSSERSAELESNVARHQGFSGSIDAYLSGSKSNATKNMQAKNNTADTTAKNMSDDEKQTQTSSHEQNENGNAYHGGIDDYLAKYGDGKQTKLNNSSEKPFKQKEHMGFHGSYEDYAKKYN